METQCIKLKRLVYTDSNHIFTIKTSFKPHKYSTAQYRKLTLSMGAYRQLQYSIMTTSGHSRSMSENTLHLYELNGCKSLNSPNKAHNKRTVLITNTVKQNPE